MWTLAWVLAAAFAFVMVTRKCFLMSLSPTLSTLDYPIQVLSTLRILHGELPFRDFQTLYGPLGYMISAIALWPLRAYTAVNAYNMYVLGCLVFFYGIVCLGISRLRLGRPLFLAAVVALLVASPVFLVKTTWYSLPMLMPVLLGMLTVQFAAPSPLRSSNRTILWQVLTGALLAAQMFIRFNFGVYLGVAIFAVGAAAFFFGEKQIAHAAFRCLAFTLAFLCLFSLAFGVAGGLVPFLTDLWTYLPRAAPGRKIEWRYVDHSLAWVAAASVAAALLRPALRIARRQIDFSLVPYIALVGFFSYTFLRFDGVHMVPLLALSLLLLADPASEPARVPSGAEPWYSRWFGLAELQVAALVLLFHFLSPIRPLLGFQTRVLHLPVRKVADPQEPGVSSVYEPTATLHDVVVYAREAEMLHRLDAMRNAGDEVFWMSTPRACQSTFDGCANIALYLADDTLPRQAVWYFDTVSTPYPDIQERIIKNLEAKRTPWIGVQDVYVPNPIGGPNVRSTLLIDYVLIHYNQVFTTEIPTRNRRYAVYSRRQEH